MILVLVLVFGLIMVGGAVAALYTKDMVSAIVASGIVSLLASILYLVYGAPDVAMTEAAIGSALTTVVFLYAWNRIVKQRQQDKQLDKQREEDKK